MDSLNSSPLDQFKSKQILRSTSSSKPLPSDQTPVISSITPEKPIDPPRRITNRRAALSIKEVRAAAQNLRKLGPDPNNRPDPLIDGARLQISAWPSEPPVGKTTKKVDGSVKLPQKYEILDKFFHSLDSSIRLLRLKGSKTTFTNISPKIECLTDRRFTYGHLAQLKFILPEAIELKKVLIHDERTSCMKPDLHVTLNVDAIENDGKFKSDSGSLLRKAFRSRLVDFSKAHPEENEVPEEALPEPFNQSKQELHEIIMKAPKSSLMSDASTDAVSERQPAVASHLSQSFQRRFSQKSSNQKTVNMNQEQSTLYLRGSVIPASEPYFDLCSSRKGISASAAAPHPTKSSSKPTIREKCKVLETSAASPPPSHPVATPVKKIDSRKNEDCSSMGAASIQGTPAKLVSTPVRLMSVTPALQQPKRCCMSPDDDSAKSPNKLVRRPPRSRSLKFDTPVKNTKFEDGVNESQTSLVHSDLFDILPENLLQSIREKERKALEDQDPAISQAKRRQQMITSLPKLFDRIHFLFQSIKRSVMTKEELMHRIIASHLDIVDRREVVEQLRLLQELVPEWIYEKSASSGDLLLCINKISSPESIRKRLAEAN